MNSGHKRIRALAVTGEARKARFTWIDLLVLAAVLTTLAVVAHASTTGEKAAAPESQATLISPEISQLPNDPGLVKARIRLATGL